MTITKTLFGNTPDGRQVYLYTLDNGCGMTVKITNYGGIVTALTVPDKHGRPGDVVLGFDNFEQYLQDHPYFGAIVGRFCNRIKNARFTLNGIPYELAANDGPNHLHGGITGFDKVLWKPEEFSGGDDVGLRLCYVSKDGEEGYPGNLDVCVMYSITDSNRLIIDFSAKTDAATPVNLTHHGYFNLKGAGCGDILDHRLAIYAGQYAPSDERLIPTGELPAVIGTPLDFNTPTDIGARIHEVTDGCGNGYDTSYLVDGWTESHLKLRHAADVYEPVSGRVMEVLSTEPDIHLYTGNFLDGAITGKNGAVYGKHSAFCLETQHFPDSPNQPRFPTTILEPGRKYSHTTVYAFGIRDGGE
jgi:aldose 1-epimerase